MLNLKRKPNSLLLLCTKGRGEEGLAAMPARNAKHWFRFTSVPGRLLYPVSVCLLPLQQMALSSRTTLAMLLSLLGKISF